MRLLLTLLLLVPLAMFAIACNDDDDDPDSTSPGELTTEDRTAIEETVEDYFSALADQDRDRIRDMLHRDADDPDMDRVMEQDRDHRWEFMEIESIEGDHDRATARLRLRDGSGEEQMRDMHLERDQDQWRLRDPELHE